MYQNGVDRHRWVHIFVSIAFFSCIFPAAAAAVTLRAPSAVESTSGKVFQSWAIPSVNFQTDALTVDGSGYAGTYSNDHGLGVAAQSVTFTNAVSSVVVTSGTQAVIIAAECLGGHKWTASSWRLPDGAGAFFASWAKVNGKLDGSVYADTYLHGNGGAALTRAGYDRSVGTTGYGALANRGGAYSLIVAQRNPNLSWRLSGFAGGAISGADNAAVVKRVAAASVSDAALGELDLEANGAGSVYEGQPSGSEANTFDAAGTWQGKRGYAIVSAIEASAVIAAAAAVEPSDLVAKARAGLPTATAPVPPTDWDGAGLEPEIGSADDMRSWVRSAWGGFLGDAEKFRDWFWWMRPLDREW